MGNVVSHNDCQKKLWHRPVAGFWPAGTLAVQVTETAAKVRSVYEMRDKFVPADWASGNRLSEAGVFGFYNHELPLGSKTLETLDEAEVEAIEGMVVGLAKKSPAMLGSAMINTSFFNYGTDPEMFLEDKGQVLPAWMCLPAKEEAKEAWAWKSKNFGYWDGFQAELVVNPNHCHGWLMDNIHAGLQHMLGEIRKTRPQVKLSFSSVVEIPQETLNTAEEAFIALGCTPSENAYNLHGTTVEEPRALRYRFAGGHYHYDSRGRKITPKLAQRMVKAADMYAGLPALLMFQNLDSPIRRKYYGLPGEHRLPPWGVEYRSLSNAWMMHPAVAHYTLSLVRKGLQLGLENLHGVFDYREEDIPQIIMQGDLDAAKKLIQRNIGLYSILMDREIKLSAAIRHKGGPEKLLKESLAQLTEPIDMRVPLTSVEENWHIDGVNGDWKKHSEASTCQWQSLILGPSAELGIW